MLSIKLKADKFDSYPMEDDLDRLIKAINIRTSTSSLGPSSQIASHQIKKSALKKPIRVGPSQASGIGISESVTLKQALRRLCISQASEMAAMKRLTKPASVSGFSESGLINKLYTSVVDEEKRNLIEISVMHDEISPDRSLRGNKCCKRQNMSASHATVLDISVVPKIRIQDVINPMYAEAEDNSPARRGKDKGKMKTTISNSCMTASRKTALTSIAVNPASQNKTSVKKTGVQD